MKLDFKPGLCANCGDKVWVTDAYQRLVAPMSHLREGYLVFEGDYRLKIPLCETCEGDEGKNLTEILQNLLNGNQARNFVGKTPIAYDNFEQHWADKGVEVKGVWHGAIPKAFVIRKGADNG